MTRASWILRAFCSGVVALACLLAFTLVWTVRSVRSETRDLVTFVAFMVFVVALNEAVECVSRCRPDGRAPHARH